MTANRQTSFHSRCAGVFNYRLRPRDGTPWVFMLPRHGLQRHAMPTAWAFRTVLHWYTGVGGQIPTAITVQVGKDTACVGAK